MNSGRTAPRRVLATGKAFPMVFCAILGLLRAEAAPATSETVRLSSVGELKARFRRGDVVAAVPSGDEYFSGCERNPAPGRAPRDRLYRFDKNALEVSPVFSAEQEQTLLGGGKSIVRLTAAAEANVVCVEISYGTPGGKVSDDLVVVRPAEPSVETLVADDRYNYAPSFSPNGRWLAYYSSDGRMWNVDPETVIEHNAGRVACLADKTVRTCVEPFMQKDHWLLAPPVWLANNRVLFCTMTSDPRVVREVCGRGYSSATCGCAVLADMESGDVRRLFVPVSMFPKVYPDPPRDRLVFWTVSTIYQTDYNLDNKKQLLNVEDESKALSFFGLAEDGSLKYALIDKNKELRALYQHFPETREKLEKDHPELFPPATP